MRITRDLLLAYIIVFNIIFSFNLIATFLPIYLDQVGITLTNIGIIFALAAIAAGIIRFPLGTLADKYGKKPLMVFGAIGYPIFALGVALANKTPHFVGLKLLIDLFQSIFWIAFWVYLFNILTRGEEGKQIALRNVAVGVGLVAAPLVGGLVIEKFGFPQLFYISAIISSLSIFLILLVREPPYKHKEENLLEEYSSLIHKPKFRSLLLIGILHNIGWVIWYIYMPIYLREMGFSMSAIGLLLSVNYLAYTLNTYPIGKLIDKVHSHYLIIPGFFLVWAMGYLFLLTTNYVVLTLSRTIMGFGQDICWQPLIARLTHTTPKKELGAAVGLFRAGVTVAVGIVSIIAGWLADLYGIKPLLFGAATFAFVSGLIVLFRYRHIKERGAALLHKHHLVHAHIHRGVLH